MEKDLKAINKLARKINDEKLRALLDEVIDKVEEDDTEEPTSEGEPAKVEEKADATPTPPVEETPTEEKKTYDLDEIKTQLGFDKVEAVIVSYDEKIKKLEEELKKSRNSGYAPGGQPQEPDTTVDDIFARLKTNHIKK